MNSLLQFIDWGYIVQVIIIGIITSFIVEAVCIVTPKEITSKILLVAVSLVVSLLKTDYTFSTIDLIRAFTLNLLINMSVAILFYTYAGKWTVDKIFTTFKQKFGNDVDNMVNNKSADNK